MDTTHNDPCTLGLGEACEFEGSCAEQGPVTHLAHWRTETGTRVSHYSARWGTREGIIRVCRGNTRNGTRFSVQWDDGSWSDYIGRLTVLAAPVSA